MGSIQRSDISDKVRRPLPEGTLVCFEDDDGKAQAGYVKASGMYMLWVEHLENRDMTTFIRYTDLIWVLDV